LIGKEKDDEQYFNYSNTPVALGSGILRLRLGGDHSRASDHCTDHRWTAIYSRPQNENETTGKILLISRTRCYTQAFTGK